MNKPTENIEKLRKLVNEVFGLAQFETEIREVIGNTNWNVLAERARDARAALPHLSAALAVEAGADAALTYDEVEAIILKTEPATLSDHGDKIWTRRMAVALANLFNARLSALHPRIVGGGGEAVAWCQPNYEGKVHPRKFMVVYEDQDMGNAVFEDEAEAREHFEKASIAWNCYLFGLLPRLPASPAPHQEGRADV